MADKPLPRNRSREGQRARQDLYIAMLRKGMNHEEACASFDLGRDTPRKWAYSLGTNAEQLEWRARVKEAKRQSKVIASGKFPDFLTFRERHFAYMNRRAGKHEATGQWTVVGARNSWYQRDSQEKLERSRRLE